MSLLSRNGSNIIQVIFVVYLLGNGGGSAVNYYLDGLRLGCNSYVGFSHSYQLARHCSLSGVHVGSFFNSLDFRFLKLQQNT